MEDREYVSPIRVSESDGMIRIAYDCVLVDFPPDGPVPAGAPPLACRVFEAIKGLQADADAAG